MRRTTRAIAIATIALVATVGGGLAGGATAADAATPAAVAASGAGASAAAAPAAQGGAATRAITPRRSTADPAGDGSLAAGPTPAPSEGPRARTKRGLPRLEKADARTLGAQAAALPSGLRTAVRSQLGVTPAQFLAQGATAAQATALIDAARAAGVQVTSARLDGTAVTLTVPTQADAAALAGTGATVVVGADPAPVLSAPRTPLHTAADPSVSTGVHGGQGWWAPASSGQGGYACSIGFNGYDTVARVVAFVTAGHCEANPVLRVAYSTGSTSIDTVLTSGGYTGIGTPDASSFAFGSDGNDSGLVDTAPSIATPADVTTWGSAPIGQGADVTTGTSSGTGTSDSGQSVHVLGATGVIQGASVCRSGYRSGWQCGLILGVLPNQSVCPSDDPGCGAHVDTIATSACSQEGDSGGSFVIGQFALGILSGSNWPAQAPGGPPECTVAAAAANNVVARQYLDAGDTASASAAWNALHVSAAFPLLSYQSPESASPSASIHAQNPGWQLGVWFAAPTVTTATTGAVAGTVPLDPTPGAANPNAVQLTVDGGPAVTVPVAADGSWSAPTLVTGTGHRYSATAASTQAGFDYSRSTTVTGALAPVTAKVSGTPKVRATLTASSAGWPRGATVSYRWYANGEPIAGASKRTLVLKAGQYRTRITVRATARLAGFPSVTAVSAATKAIAAGTMRPVTPKITGTARVGKTLREHPGSWSPVSVKRTVRWFANGKPITGATRSTLKLTKALMGKRISVKVTARHAGYVTTSRTSKRTVPVR